MRSLFLLILLLGGRVATGFGQDLSVAQLVNLTELSNGRSADLNEWSFRPPTPQAAEEPLTWSWRPFNESDSAGTAPLQLSLRPAPQGYDVVLYIKRLPIYNQLRRELERKRNEPVPVTCLGANCLGFRFNLPTCTVAFYEGKAGDYPFMVVVQPKAGRPALPVVPTGPVKSGKPKPKPAGTASPAAGTATTAIR